MDSFLVSIHAPVKGATFSFERCGKFVYVSIHAPVKGATTIYEIHQLRDYVSIHAPVKGATITAGEIRIFRTFQFTHP